MTSLNYVCFWHWCRLESTFTCVKSPKRQWAVRSFITSPWTFAQGFAWHVFAGDDMFISHWCKDHESSYLDEQVSLHRLSLLMFLKIVMFSVHLESSRRESFGRWSATWDAKSIWQGCQHAPVLKTSQDHVGLILNQFRPSCKSFIRHYLSQIMEVARSWDNKNKKLDVVRHCIQMHPKQTWTKDTYYTASIWCNGCNSPAPRSNIFAMHRSFIEIWSKHLKGFGFTHFFAVLFSRSGNGSKFAFDCKVASSCLKHLDFGEYSLGWEVPT